MIMMNLAAVFSVLPCRVQEVFFRGGIRPEQYEELRIRRNRPLMLRKNSRTLYLCRDGSLSEVPPAPEQALIPTDEEMERILLTASRFSVYAVEEQLKEGYLTLQGGHRLGIAGEVMERDGRVEGIRRIQAYNLRIAHEATGCGEAVYPWLWEEEELLNTLIVSAPGCGKTTLLRDLIRMISNGTAAHPPLTVGLADERSEIAACAGGIPQNDIGANTDVMDKGPKVKTLRLLLRTMSPQVLAADEAGSIEDARILTAARGWGVHILATLHGSMEGRALRDSGLEGVFSRYIEITGSPVRQYRIFDEKKTCLAVISERVLQKGGS